jgi:hypothetical protein
VIDVRQHAETILAHPEFDDAAMAFCQRLSLNYCNRNLPHVAFAQMERWVLAMLILHLGGITPRYMRDGATLATLISICAKGGYGSRKLVRDVIAYFGSKNLIVERDVPGDKRKKALFANDKLIRTFEADVMARLSVLDIVSKERLPLVDYIDSSHILMRFVDSHVEDFLNNDQRITDGFPEIRQFLDHAHGYIIFLHIIGAAQRQPGGSVIAVTSRAAIASHLAVSRPHVAKLVNTAKLRGWLTTDTHAKIFELCPAFYARSQLWIAHELAMMKSALSEK